MLKLKSTRFGKMLMKLYKELLNKYGKQYWWPADTPFEVAVGAILTQNTNWKNVEKAIKNLKKYDLIDPSKIIKEDINKLKDLIRPAGFFNQKAERLKSIAKFWMKLNPNLGTIKLRKQLLNIKGVGKETADSILLYALNKRIFVIDAYTKRFCSYYKLIEAKDYETYRIFFESNLPKDIDIYKEFHALIVQWGKDNKK